MIFQDPASSLNERANVDYIISEGLYNFKLFETKEIESNQKDWFRKRDLMQYKYFINTK